MSTRQQVGNLLIRFLAIACITATSVIALPRGSSTCVKFIAPRPGTLISSPACTIRAEACPVARAMEFRAVFYRADGTTRDTLSLGKLTRPPYRVVWSLANVPNQLGEGATILAYPEFDSGEVGLTRLAGVFLAHNAFERPSYDASRISGMGSEGAEHAAELNATDASARGRARMYWDDGNLVFAVTVEDVSYRATLPETVLRNTVVEVLIDQSQTPLAYPSDSVLALRMPLLGEIQRRRYRPQFLADGEGGIGTKLEPYTQHHSVKTAEGRGWKVVCLIPQSYLGQNVPETIRANIIARIPRSDSTQTILSWTGSSPQEMYAPLRWGTVTLRAKPITSRPLPMYLFGAALGLLLTLGGYPIVRNMGKVRGMVLQFETPEGEKKILELVRTFIDARVPDKALSREDVSNEFSVEPARLDRLLQKYTGKPFHAYLMSLRVEAAKERLRSSNANEAAIAEQCGFKNVEEMERMFLTHSGVTPYRFRLEQQVT